MATGRHGAENTSSTCTLVADAVVADSAAPRRTRDTLDSTSVRREVVALPPQNCRLRHGVAGLLVAKCPVVVAAAVAVQSTSVADQRTRT